MNPITFNDIFDRALSELPPNMEQPPVLGNWRTSPLFDYETTYEKERNVLYEQRNGISFPELEEMSWPFETFRLNLVERNVPMDERAVGSPNDVYRSRFILHRHADTHIIHALVLFRKFKGGQDLILLIRSEGTPDGKGFAQVYTPQSGWIADVSSRHLQGCSIMAGSAVGSLGGFLIDVMMPSNHICEVRPNQPERSVEWVKARTHFTLITHGHPANKKDVGEQARVQSDRNEELRRGAHSRREHERTYRHKRFTYARGKTITVKATWCGPKEWQDEGGKQIYRILEPVGDEGVCTLT